MLSNYTSLIEFLAAVYCTMCIDNILTQKIWSVDYFDGFRRALEGMEFGGNTTIATDLIDKNRQQVNTLQSKLTKKSVFMLFYVFLILVACGRESDASSEEMLPYIALFLTSLSSLTAISLFLSKFVFPLWKSTFITLFLASLIPILLIQSHDTVAWYSELQLRHRFVVNFVLIVLTYPILWQMFIVWVYRSLFYDYVKTSMLQVKAEYENVLDIIQNNGDISNLPSEYGEILQKNTLSHKQGKAQEAIDDSISEYAGLLEQKLKKLGYETSVLLIIGRSLKYKLFKRNLMPEPKVEMEEHTNELVNYKNKKR